MRVHLDIHGLKIHLSADHPLIFQTLLEDLASFRSPHPNGHRPIRLEITTLPPFLQGKTYPPRFLPYRETAAQNNGPDTLITRYGTAHITVITHLRKREIEAAVVPEHSILPDPAYHYLVTQPLNLWFKRKGLFFLHAGCVAERSKGILLIGHPRAGKSVLTVSAVRAGFKFLSDEQPLLSLRGGRVTAHCFPRRIRLHRAAAARFPELRAVVATGGKRVIFPIETIRNGSLQPSCRPSLLIFPRFKKHGKNRLQPIEPTAALAKLLQDDHFVWYRNKPLDKIFRRHFSLFEKLVRQASAYALEYTDREILEVPSLLRKLLKTSP